MVPGLLRWGIGMSPRDRSPGARELHRPDRLLARQRRAEASRERLPELVPARCPTCLYVIGLAEIGEDRWCRDCGGWFAVIDEFTESA